MTTKTVWKYPLTASDAQTLLMPVGAEIVHVAVQNGSPWLWARVAPANPVGPRHIRIAGTGHDLGSDEDARHIGTFMAHGDALVFHVFDCGEAPS